MSFLKTFFALSSAMYAFEALPHVPSNNETIQNLAEFLKAEQYDKAAELFSTSSYLKEFLQQNRDTLLLYLNNPATKQIAYNAYNLFFFHQKEEQGELILVLDANNKMALAPRILTIPLPELTKEQMYDDFNFMTQKLKDIFPYDEINRSVFNLDFRKVLASQREHIENISSVFEFTALIQDTLTRCKGNHLWLMDLHSLLQCNPSVKDVLNEFIKPTVEIDFLETNHILFTLSNLGISRNAPLLQYFAGGYYTIFPIILNGKDYPAGMRLISIDGELVSDIMDRLQSKMPGYDINRKLFCAVDFLKLCDNPQELDFRRQNGDMLTVKLSEFKHNMHKIPKTSPTRNSKKVLFLEEPQILYIRIPEMSLPDIDFYLNEIKAKGENQKIRAVALDVRGNEGGSDLVWEKILSALISREYPYTSTMAFPNNETIRAYLNLHREIIAKYFSEDSHNCTPSEYTEEAVPFLENSTFLVSRIEAKLVPLPDSLNLDCPIYIIAHDVYSSTGGLLSCAEHFDFITSIGLPSLYSLGQGINPIFYSLPHSKLVFSCSPEIDLSNSETALDLLHLHIENELELPPEVYFRYLNTEIPEDPTDFLLKEDPFFAKMLELLNEKESSP